MFPNKGEFILQKSSKLSQRLLLVLGFAWSLFNVVSGTTTPEISKDGQQSTLSPSPTELIVTTSTTNPAPVNLSVSEPKIFSVQRAKVETLPQTGNSTDKTQTVSSDKDKQPIKITAYTAEAEPIRRRRPRPTQEKRPIKFSKLISKEPTKITVSLFEETKKKPDPNRRTTSGSTATSSSFTYPPIFSKLIIPIPEELESQVLITEFEPMRMVESSSKMLKGGILHELHSHQKQPEEPQVLHYFQPSPEANYQYFTQGSAHPQPQQYYPTEVVPVPQVQENEVQLEVEPQPQPKRYTTFMAPPPPLPSPQYNFAYRVHDAKSGTNHGHTEFRSGGMVHGRYAVMDPDGLLRTVSYTSHPGKS